MHYDNELTNVHIWVRKDFFRTLLELFMSERHKSRGHDCWSLPLVFSSHWRCSIFCSKTTLMLWFLRNACFRFDLNSFSFRCTSEAPYLLISDMFCAKCMFLQLSFAGNGNRCVKVGLVGRSLHTAMEHKFLTTRVNLKLAWSDHFIVLIRRRLLGIRLDFTARVLALQMFRVIISFFIDEYCRFFHASARLKL